MLDGVGRFAMHRFAMQVKGGEYRQDVAGQWDCGRRTAA